MSFILYFFIFLFSTHSTLVITGFTGSHKVSAIRVKVCAWLGLIAHITGATLLLFKDSLLVLAPFWSSHPISPIRLLQPLLSYCSCVSSLLLEVAASSPKTSTSKSLPHSSPCMVNGCEELCGLDASMNHSCLLYTSPSPRDRTRSRMPSSA